jgi:hypothetical protein
MSCVAEVDSEPQLFTKICQFLSFRPKERPEFAHPWSAFRPESYLAGMPPPGIVIATQAHKLIDSEPAVSTPEAPPAIAPVQRHLSLVVLAGNPAKQEEGMSEPVSERAAASPPAPLAPPREPQDFQLPARLHSVSKLNRIVAPEVKSARGTSKKSFSANRPARVGVKPKRLLSIQPPAVLRKKRKTAEILHLDLALARAEKRRTKANTRSAA